VSDEQVTATDVTESLVVVKALAAAVVERLEQAVRLLQWWDATNPPDDRDTRLAVQTRAYLSGQSVDVPELEVRS
jgi:hypothetical protein